MDSLKKLALSLFSMLASVLSYIPASIYTYVYTEFFTKYFLLLSRSTYQQIGLRN